MVKMYRQPIQTHNQNHTEQTFCSVLIGKIGKKFHKNSIADSSPDEVEKPHSDKANKTNKNQLEAVVKKLKKISNTLPSALQYSDAFGPGEKDCETCVMTKEKYKKEIYHSRVVDKLVDGVIDREQSESIDSDRSSVDSNNERREKSSNDKGDKYTFSVDIYRQGDPIQHNLKCILINLQQTVRDILVQIAFVKTRKLGNEERYKPFDVSVIDFKFLKYKYSSLTDIIVQLFAKPVKESGAQVCVTCVKQKLLAYNNALNDVLTKHGRDLKIVMRNESTEPEEQCCAREYPHVHAEVQGRPLVLKYSLPIQIKPQDPVVMQNTSEDNAFPKGSFDENWTRSESGLIKPKIASYNEWPPEYKEMYPSTTSLPAALQLQDKEEPTEKYPSEQELFPPPTSLKSPSKPSLASKATLNSKEHTKSSNIPLYAVPTSKLDNDPSKSSSATGKSLNSNVSIVPLAKEKAVISPSIVSLPPSIDTAESFGSQLSAPPTLIAGPKKKVSISHISSVSSNRQSAVPSHASLVSSTKEKSVSSQHSSAKPKEEPLNPSSNVPSNEPKPFKTQPEQIDKGTSKDLMDKRTVSLDKSDKAYSEPADLSNEPSDTLKTHDKPNIRDLSSDYSTSSSDGSYRSFDPRDESNSTRKVFFHDQVDKTVLQVATDGCLIGFPKSKIDNPLKNVDEDINHQNKIVEDILRHLGKDSLMKVSRPADCCQVNNFLSKEGMEPDLPLCASLFSLPLDKNDLEYIAQTSGKAIPYDCTELESKKDSPVQEYEWEKPRQADPNNTRWLQAINDQQPSTSKSCSNPGVLLDCTECPSKKRKISSKYSIYIEKLPPEEPSSVAKNKSVSKEASLSFPLDYLDEDKTKKRKKPSILKHCEIRYFTVELTDQANLKKTPHNIADSNSSVVTKNTLEEDGRKKIKRQSCKENSNSSKVNIIKNTSCESFHSCYSSESEINCDHDSQETFNLLNENGLNKNVEELTMLNVIHLCDPEFKEKEVNFLWNPPCFKSSSSILQIQDFSKTPKQREHANRIDDSYVKDLISQDETNNRGRSSYTIIKDTKLCKKRQNNGSYTKLTHFTSCTKDNNSKFVAIPKALNGNGFSISSQEELNLVTTCDERRKRKQFVNSFQIKNHLSAENGSCKVKINKTIIIPKKAYDNCTLNFDNKSSYTILGNSFLKDNSRNNFVRKETCNLQTANTCYQTYSGCGKPLKKEPMNKIHKNTEPELRKINRKMLPLINKANKCKREKLKPLLLSNSRARYVRSECRVNNLFLTYPILILIEDTILQIPQIICPHYNIIQKIVDVTDGAPLEEGKTYGPLTEKLGGKSIDEFSNEGSNFGMDKKYISVKSNLSMALRSNISLKDSFTHQNGLKNTLEINPKSSEVVLSDMTKDNNNQNEILKVISQIMHTASNNIHKTESVAKISPLSDKDEFILIDEHCKPLRLFNTKGRPLTDSSGRPLKTVCGESLIVFDEDGIPVSDWESNPVCDSLGKFMDDADFNSETQWDSEILRSFTTGSGDPKRFYDVEGMPLTSVSGTMLVNANGAGLIRVNVNGKPVSDLRGRPLYDINHQQC